MKNTGQGVLYASKLMKSFIRLLLLVIFLQASISHAEITPASTQITNEHGTEKHSVAIIYPPDSNLSSDIARTLSKILIDKNSGISVSFATARDKKTDLLVIINNADTQSIDKQYPKVNKLFISSNPQQHPSDKSSKNKKSTLYMTQSYCKQIQFIKLLDDSWQTVSFLNNLKKPIDIKIMERCAARYGMNIHIVNIENTNHLTDKIKNALNHSDVLLALPDKNIYNSKTVKNILLTSYRYRKPVIAFSGNFVSAGALASIHSNTEQIAQSASKLVKQYFKENQNFTNRINYPDAFDISINRQVFRALNLFAPDSDQLKQALQHTGPDKSGALK